VSSDGAELPVLWQIRFSHFNEKARWALDYKAVPHERRSLAPGLHSFRSRRLGGRGTTPVLVIGSEVYDDSTEIVAELERRHPEPPLYPSDADQRQSALELEEFFDTQLGPQLRAAVFHAALPHRSVTVAATTQGLGPQHRILSNVAYPVIRRAVTRALGADDGGAAEGHQKTVAALDRLEAELGDREYLVGDRFSVADLTAAALLCPLVAPPEFPYVWPDPWPEEWEEFRRSLSNRPGYRWVEETYRRHRGSSAEAAA
jgi:glutathione S-transferase